MERQYIFFYTGLALLLFGLGLLSVFVGVVVLYFWLPENKYVHIAAMGVTSFLVVWGAFKVDEWSLGRRGGKGRRGEK